MPPFCVECERPLAYVTTIPRVTEPGKVALFQYEHCKKIDIRSIEGGEGRRAPPAMLRTSRLSRLRLRPHGLYRHLRPAFPLRLVQRDLDELASGVAATGAFEVAYFVARGLRQDRPSVSLSGAGSGLSRFGLDDLRSGGCRQPIHSVQQAAHRPV
jgi:hypothetical protein